MRGRRDTDHHAQALTGAAGVVLAIAFAAAGPVCAGYQQKVALDGTVHRVSVEPAREVIFPVTSGPVVHVEVLACGDVVERVIPGTDQGWNWQPGIEIDPVTDEPTVVWSRRAGTATDLYLARFDGSAWSLPVLAAAGVGDNPRPQIRIDGKLVHVVWTTGSGDATRVLRASFDRQSLSSRYGPEILPMSAGNLVPPEGGTDSSGPGSGGEPDDDLAFFAVGVEREEPADDRVYVWGIRDEPMPVGYDRGFDLPGYVQGIRDAEAGYVGGRFVVWFEASGRLYYSFLDHGMWTNLRRIPLDEQTSASEALTQMKEMLVRTAE